MESAPEPVRYTKKPKNKTKEYTISKDKKTYNFSVNKTNKAILIKCLNYECSIKPTDLKNMTKIVLDDSDKVFQFFTIIFENKRVKIKEIELQKMIKLEINIVDYIGNEILFDFKLLYNTNSKDFIINELVLKYRSLEDEMSMLKDENKNLNNENEKYRSEMNNMKNEMNNIKNEMKNIKNEINNKMEKMNNEKKNEMYNVKEEIIKLFKSEFDNIKISLKENQVEKEKKEENSDKLLPKKINFIRELAKDSYSDLEIDHSFTAFISVDKIAYIIYPTKEKKVICINLNTNVKKEINLSHDKYITNIHHFYDEKEKKDIIMTVCAENNNIKLWNFSDFKIISDIKNINKSAFLLSSCFLKYDNNNYIVTSNGDLSENQFDQIKLYTFDGKQKYEIKDSNLNTIFLNTFYDKEQDKSYIIAGNNGFVKFYGLNENKEFSFSDEKYKKFYTSAVAIFSNSTKKMMASAEDGIIRIWDFDMMKLIVKISTECTPLRSMIIFNENYAFIGSKDNTINVLDIRKGDIIKSIQGHRNTVIAIAMINLEKYGNCLISQGMKEESIKLWKIN